MSCTGRVQQRFSTSKTGVEPVGVGLVGAEEAEVRVRRVLHERVAQPLAEATGGLGAERPGGSDVEGVVGEVGQVERHPDATPVGRGVGAHPAVAGGGHGRHLGDHAARRRRTAPRAGSCASTPRGSRGARGWCGPRSPAPGGPGRSPRSDLPVDDGRPGPPLRGAQHQRRPAPEGAPPALAGLALVLGDGVAGVVERGRQVAVHGRRGRRPPRTPGPSRGPPAGTADRLVGAATRAPSGRRSWRR